MEEIEIKLESGGAGHEQLAYLLDVCVLAVRSESHDLAFVSVLVVADELANHGVEAAERVRQEDPVENVDVSAVTMSHHRGNEIS